ncbi:MAG: PhoH family protein [Actinobacteria bacterium]|nr:PhoH family protein [Actinomycetota bacterium]
MSVVIRFEECIARPSDNGKLFWLNGHLEAVAMDCGDAQGNLEERLAFLAGLLHDAAKSHPLWQDYIIGHRAKGPAHAPLGAALFAFFADNLISEWALDHTQECKLYDLALDWTRVVYDHHGTLRDLEGDFPPWEKSVSSADIAVFANECDLDGVFRLVASHFDGSSCGPDEFYRWLKKFPRSWERRVRLERRKLLIHSSTARECDEKSTLKAATRMPTLAARLIKADRYHAGGYGSVALESDSAVAGIENLQETCCAKAKTALSQGADENLVRLRQGIQRRVLERYTRNPDASFYTLLLPTGYGKTLSAVNVALSACSTGRCRRIIYVAPYLSILSQAAGEIASATNVEVVQHHHLSIAEQDDEDLIDALETWQAPMLATTFNQFFRAIFPSRAQHCLRVEALRKAFVIVDEPQIIDTAVWNVFLQALTAASLELRFQVLFATATLPPLESGIGDRVVALAPPVSAAQRYEVQYISRPLGVEDLASSALNAVSEVGNVAVVMNTVRDAADIFKSLSTKARNVVDGLYCLTALMLPSHKADTIQRLRHDLAANKRVIAICTQIIEAGVDLSFRAVYRALPIFPSVAQVAGRANRHGEGSLAKVFVFPFERRDGVDSRKYVYRDITARNQTDQLFNERNSWHEEDIGFCLSAYYLQCWEENRNTAVLRKFDEAAGGKWSSLAGLEPFGANAPRISMFVPRSDI